MPLVIFAISRLAKEAICPDCRQDIPRTKVPFDLEAAVMIGLIVLCVGGGIGTLIINQMNQPSPECAVALEAVKEGGGPDLWTISEADLGPVDGGRTKRIGDPGEPRQRLLAGR